MDVAHFVVFADDVLVAALVVVAAPVVVADDVLVAVVVVVAAAVHFIDYYQIMYLENWWH